MKTRAQVPQPPPGKRITRHRRDQERCDAMLIEFIGGPLDGSRLTLDVVREGPQEIRVLEMGYTQAFQSRSTGSTEGEPRSKPTG
jgi:hypothetical protein